MSGRGIRWTEGVARDRLPNGITLLAQAVPGASAVAVLTHVRTGFFDEPDELTGVSHVLEHMLFKGTPTRGVGEIAREMKAAGGYLNAGTGYDHTVYYAVLPPQALPVALDLQSDAVRRSVIDPGELTRELRVIIEEAKRKLDTPSAVAAETLHALLFDRHRIRRWRIGTETQLAALSHAAVLGFYRSRYVPSRAIVALAGDLDPERALAGARDAYGSWAAAAPTIDPSPDEPERHELRTRTLRGDLRQAELALGWRSVPALHPDAAALDLAALILGSGRASWLYRSLRASGQVTSIGASHYTPTEVGVFAVAADLDAGNLDAALRGIAEAAERLRDPGPSEADLARARTLLTARWARQLQTAEGRAGALAGAEALGGVQLLDEEYDRLLAVDAAEVRRVADRWLRGDSVSAVAYLPAAAAEALDFDRLRSAFSSPARLPLPAIELPALPAALPLPTRGQHKGAILHVPLAGADLLIARKAGVPLVSLGIYHRRSMPEAASAAGLAALAVRSAVRGAGPFDAAELALAFERLGGTVAPLISADWFGFGTTVLAPYALEAASLLDLVLHAPSFAAAEVGLERATLAEEASQIADDMARYPIQLALRAAFGDSRYGLPSLGFPETIPTLTEGMLRAWHAGELAHGRTTLVAVGELDPERVAEQLAGVFSEQPARAPAEPAAAALWQADGTAASSRVVERDKRQTAIALSYPGPTRAQPARHAAVVWSAIASGLGGRLFTRLREERSLAYSVFGSSWQRAGAGAMLVYLATSPAREEEAREALHRELARFTEEPPSAEELGQAVNYITGQIPVERQTAGAVAAEIAEAWLIGTGVEELIDSAAPFRAVDRLAVQRLAAECFQPGMRGEGLIRGR